jgi:Copper binding proteins, plastocyanin/azurin family
MVMNTKDTVATLFVAGIAVISLAIAISPFVPFPSGQQEAVAQQNDTTTTNQSTMPPASSNKTFSIFSTEVQGLEETYIYSLPIIVANRDDSVTVNLHNIEETTEEDTEGGTEATEATEGRHSFTIDTQPYSVDLDTAAGETRNATFTADQEGIFHYYCKYHPQTMTGQLVVLPQPSPASLSQPAT